MYVHICVSVQSVSTSMFSNFCTGVGFYSLQWNLTDRLIHNVVNHEVAFIVIYKVHFYITALET